MTSWGWSRYEKNKVWFQGDFKAWKDLFTLVNNWCWFKLFGIQRSLKVLKSDEIIIELVKVLQLFKNCDETQYLGKCSKNTIKKIFYV